MNKSDHSKDEDTAWNTEIELSIVPDPHLDKLQKKVIAHDYGMKRHKLSVPCKAALLQYVLQAYRLDPHKQELSQRRSKL